MIRLDLPWPPSVNHYWRYGRGNVHISPEGRRYKLMVAGIIAAAGIRPLSGKLRVVLDAWPPDRRRRDLDNIEKATLDACIVRPGFATGLYHDDAQIKRKESTMWDFDPERPGRLTLAIEPWQEPSMAMIPVVAPQPCLVTARRRKPTEETPRPIPAPPSCQLPAMVRTWLSGLLPTP